MELMIDNLPCDLAPQPLTHWSWSTLPLHSVSGWRTAREVNLTLPFTPNNAALLGDADQIHLTERFNHKAHTASLRVEGEELLAGRIWLRGCDTTNREHFYRLTLRCRTADWAHAAALGRLSELDIDFSMLLTPTAIVESWSSESPVKMLPILYDRYESSYAESSLGVVERILSTDNYHPFLHLATLVRAIVEQNGYTLTSRFVESDWFQHLYISGGYNLQDAAAREARMGFFARRTTDTTASANYAGRVYASPYMVVNSVGNLVDAFQPTAMDSAGNLLSDCYSRNNCLQLVDDALLYTPTSEVEVGFEYHLHYRTDYRILSRTRLRGFDSLYLGTNADFCYALTNSFSDRRSDLVAGQSYRLLIFDFQRGEQYRLLQASGEVVAEVDTRSAALTLAEDFDSSLTLYRLEDGVWSRYEGDWALYDGYITETGTTEVEFTVRTPAEPLGPTTPKRFQGLYLYGAEEGMELTLLRGTTLRPYFSMRPGLGSELSWCDVAHLECRQSELLEALAHLFNWRIFSSERERRVVIEPESDFYLAEQAVDWSARPVEGEWLLLESDSEEHATRAYAYLGGDGAVERYNAQTGEQLGSWTTRMSSLATLQGNERLQNPLFSPTLNQTEALASAPSASIPVVGNRDAEAALDDFAFTPRILYYVGLVPLPAGERWSYPAPEGYYPLAAFHFAGDDTTAGFTLGFEDRDGLQGLHRFYDESLRHRDLAQTLELELLLTASEVAALEHYLDEEDLSRKAEVAINRLYRLRIGGEWSRLRLERIDHYDPTTGLARCRFTRMADDRL